MTEHTHQFSDWPFLDAVNALAFCTADVAQQHLPILQVSHDFDGDWQFLDATTETPGECVMLCLGCVYERDATLAQIGDLPRGWSAYRICIGADWERWEKSPEADDCEQEVNDGEQKALAHIEEYGLHIISVNEEDDLPPFSYSIGIEQSLAMPDLIVVGLRHEVAQAVINECYRQMKSGKLIAPGSRVADLLGGEFECVIGEVSPANIKEYMGWALWLYKGANCRAHQIIFPSTAGVFPWEPEASEWFRNWQPLLA